MNRIQSLRRTLALGGLALTVVAAAGCTGDDSASKTSAANRTLRGRFELASSLVPVDDCKDLLAYFKDEAAKQVTAYGLPGLGGGGIYLAEDAVSRGVATTAVAATNGASPPVAAGSSGSGDAVSAEKAASNSDGANTASPGFSSTNVVEEGVDEPDSVKTDGKHLYTWAGNRLRVLAIEGSGAAVEVGSLELSGYGNQLLLSGNRLLVLGTTDEAVANPSEKSSRPIYQGSRAALSLVDVSDPAKPKLLRQLVADGSVLNARMVGGVARVVVQSAPNGLEFVQPAGPGSEDRALSVNKEVIATSTIDDWAPHFELRTGAGKVEQEGQLAACEGYHHPPTFSGFSTVSVLTVDLADNLQPGGGAAIVADGQRVYASKDNLYVALSSLDIPIPVDIGGSNGSNGGAAESGRSIEIAPAPDRPQATTTAIHQFSISGKEPAVYVASGEVEGALLNDFSMSEHNGNVRVAATTGTMFGPTGEQSESHIAVLRRDGTTLRPLGDVGGLGKGERIYAVRFVGNVGYVVTFRQTDPLYTVDLSVPEKPAVVGELELLGYSAYLHPLGEGRLLGIGQDATDTGSRLGAQVSLFDVSDPAHPTRLANQVLPNGWSSVEGDYHSFLWWAPSRLALVPITGYDATTNTPLAAMIGLDVGASSLSERGRIAHPTQDVACEQGKPVPADGATSSASPGSTGRGDAIAPPCFVNPWAPVSRAVVIGERVFTLSETGVMSSDLGNLTSQGWLPFA